jgi:hypothetical protein
MKKYTKLTKEKYLELVNNRKGKNGKRAAEYCQSRGTAYTHEQFIQALKYIYKKHDNLSFEKTKYINAREKVIITCAKHGDFSVNAGEFIHKKIGCRLCAKEKSSGEKIKRQHVIKKFTQHRTDFTKFKALLKVRQPELKLLMFRTVLDPAVVECKRCGQAWIRSNCQGLQTAGRKLQCTCNQDLNTSKSTKQRFFKDIKKKYPQYDFKKTKYESLSISSKVIVTCKLHGDFETSAQNIRHSQAVNACKECQRLARPSYEAKNEKEAEEIKQIKKYNERYKEIFGGSWRERRKRKALQERQQQEKKLLKQGIS